MEMNCAIKITAILYDVEYGAGGAVALGMIKSDTRDRFLDGANVRTSEIVYHDTVNNILYTRNSIYKIASWAKEM